MSSRICSECKNEIPYPTVDAERGPRGLCIPCWSDWHDANPRGLIKEMIDKYDLPWPGYNRPRDWTDADEDRKRKSEPVLREGYIKKGGVNRAPMTPRPAPPQGLSPKPLREGDTKTGGKNLKPKTPKPTDPPAPLPIGKPRANQEPCPCFFCHGKEELPDSHVIHKTRGGGFWDALKLLFRKD